MANIALDYDSTYTVDPELWDEFIDSAQQKGHNVYVVTMRYDNPHEARPVREALQNKVEGIFFTGRKAKRSFMYERSININIWIDDTPDFIIMDAKE